MMWFYESTLEKDERQETETREGRARITAGSAMVGHQDIRLGEGAVSRDKALPRSALEEEQAAESLSRVRAWQRRQKRRSLRFH